MSKGIEPCPIHGQDSRSSSNEKTSSWKCVVWESALQRFKLLPDLIVRGLRYGLACRKQRQKQEKQEWALEKPMLDNARKLRGIYCFDPEDEKFQETIKCKKEVRSSCGSCCALQQWGPDSVLGS